MRESVMLRYSLRERKRESAMAKTERIQRLRERSEVF